MKFVIFALIIVAVSAGCIKDEHHIAIIGGRDTHFTVLDVLNDIIEKLDSEANGSYSIESVTRVSQQLVNGLKYNFVLLMRLRIGEEYKKQYYSVNYYTGSFPIDFKNAKLESFEAIDEEDIPPVKEHPEIPGAPKTHFPIITALNTVIKQVNEMKNAKFSFTKILAASKQLVNGEKFEFTLQTEKDVNGALTQNDCYFNYLHGPFPIDPEEEGKLQFFFEMPNSLKELNPEAQNGKIDDAVIQISKYLKSVAANTGEEYAVKRVDKVDETIPTNEDETDTVMKMIVLLEGVNVNCIEQREFWVLFRNDYVGHIIFSQSVPFRRP